MNPLNDPARHSGMTLARRLGQEAAASPITAQASPSQLATAPTPQIPSRLAAVFEHFRRRQDRREQAYDDLRVAESVAP